MLDKQEFLNKHDMTEITSESGIIIDIKYATADNFMKQTLYDNNVCFLRKGTANKLIALNKELNKLGYRLKIWDAFRPISVQRKMWDLFPNEEYVANPDKDKANHCKGSAVDVTICDLNNKELKMPTEYDYFGKESSRNYYEYLDEETRRNVQLLENKMITYGFEPFLTEWWHFNDLDSYEIIREFYDE